MQIVEYVAGGHGTLESGHYANRVTVAGQSPTGQPLYWTLSDWDAIGPQDAAGADYVGWPITDVDNTMGVTHWRAAEAKAWLRLRDMQAIALHLRPVYMPFNPSIRPGDTARIYGAANVGAHNRKLRIAAVAHAPRAMRTTVYAHEMVGPSG